MFEIVGLFSQLWSAIAGATPEALVKALFVLVAILGLRIVKVLPSSKWARAANVVFSVLLSGVVAGGASQSEVAVMTLTAAFSAGVWDLIAKLLASQGKKLF